MSTISKINKKNKSIEKIKPVENFMGETSYELSPLETLKIVTASQIFGEKSFYRMSKINLLNNEKLISNKEDLLFSSFDNNDLMIENVIDKALDFNFQKTLEFAIELRNDYYMRLNPAIIYMRSLIHKNRIEFTKQNPGLMNEYASKIIRIPSDLTNMFDYYIYIKGGIKNIPTLFKRIAAKELSKMSKYHIAKYKSKSLINIIRTVHANSEIINELMRTGKIEILNDEENTWERLRSEGKKWSEIISTIKIPHMALVRNIRGIGLELTENKNKDYEKVKELISLMKSGVKNGKLFPFRYFSAYKEVEKASIETFIKQIILDGLNECIEVALDNFPKLKGNTISLCDNSGSARNQLTTEYGTMFIADIANLSGVITAKCAENGYVGLFGDKLNIVKIDKEDKVLKEISKLPVKVGERTENGIWLFFKQAIENKEHWDNIFIYSDMQAGHGQLYGINPGDYEDFSYQHSRNIDLLKLVKKYRSTVNSKVNIFSVQVAGYNNNIMPENLYRGAILSGWTGKEVAFAEKLIKIWEEKENNNERV